MEEEILNELKTLTENLKEDVQLRSEELQLQVEKSANEQELAEIAEKEQEQEQLELDAEKAKDEQRAVQVEQFIEKLESQEEPDNEFRIQVLDSLQKISTKLDELSVISTKLDATEQSQNLYDASYFSSMTIILFLGFAIPAVAIYKFLSRLFDSFTA